MSNIPVISEQDVTEPPTETVYGDPDPNFYQTAYGQLISSYGDLVKKVMDQNDKIDEQISEYENIHSTDYQKSVYESGSTEYLHTIYVYLFYIYYAIVLIVVLFGLYKGAFSFAAPFTLLVTLCLIIFPFVIYYIEQQIYSFLLYIWSLLTDNVYLAGDY